MTNKQEDGLTAGQSVTKSSDHDATRQALDLLGKIQWMYSLGLLIGFCGSLVVFSREIHDRLGGLPESGGWIIFLILLNIGSFWITIQVPREALKRGASLMHMLWTGGILIGVLVFSLNLLSIIIVLTN